MDRGPSNWYYTGDMLILKKIQPTAKQHLPFINLEYPMPVSHFLSLLISHSHA